MIGINPITGLNLKEECELIMSNSELLNNLKLVKLKDIKLNLLIEDIMRSPLNLKENGDLRFQKTGLEMRLTDELANLATTEFNFNLNDYSKIKCISCHFTPANTKRLNIKYGDTHISDLIEINLSNGQMESYVAGAFHDYKNTNFHKIYNEFIKKSGGKIPAKSKEIVNVKLKNITTNNENEGKNITSEEKQELITDEILLTEATSNNKKNDRDLKFTKIETSEIELEEVDGFSQEEINQQDIFAKQFDGLERSAVIKSLGENEEQELISKNSVSYKRNSKRIGAIKYLGDFKCQICKTYILKKNGDKYIEAAHIKPKHLGSQETLQNILLLCPNHHKEFDYGKLEIYKDKWTKSSITFILNEIEHTINFIIK